MNRRNSYYICIIPIPFLLSFVIQMAVATFARMAPIGVSGVLMRMLIGVIYCVVFLGWYYKCFGRKPEVEAKDVITFKNMLLLFVLAVAGQFIISFFLTLILPLIEGATDQYQSSMQSLFQQSWMSILYVVLLAPIGEECIFRGLTYQYAKKAFPTAVANVVQAALFGLYHMSLVQGLYAFVMGLVFGNVVYKLKSLWPAVFLHVILNITGLLLNEYAPDDITLIGKVLGLAVSLFAGVCAVKWLPTLEKRVVYIKDNQDEVEPVPKH